MAHLVRIERFVQSLCAPLFAQTCGTPILIMATRLSTLRRIDQFPHCFGRVAPAWAFQVFPAAEFSVVLIGNDADVGFRCNKVMPIVKIVEANNRSHHGNNTPKDGPQTNSSLVKNDIGRSHRA